MSHILIFNTWICLLDLLVLLGKPDGSLTAFIYPFLGIYASQ